tara:strand:- start:640 stop:1635 length:996 start_codon:yes stop_codon:yes gene_type:complete
MENLLKKLSGKIDLSFDETKAIFTKIMNGEATEENMHEFLTLLSNKGEVSSEIAAGVYVLREKSLRVNVENAIDTCGTGGDGKNTLNISTASALLLASMGIKVAKHGNKAVSSKCGSADVLEKLNININLDAKSVENSINNFNFGFMFAPNFHSAMKYVGPVRKKIGKRTIFNMIGPLSSPALVKKQVVGVFDIKLLKIFANALRDLEITNAWIVNSDDGLDEISPYAKTNVCKLQNGRISNIQIDPNELEIKTNGFKTILGKDAEYNSQKIVDIFKGEDNDFSIAVCLNAAAGLMVSEKFDNFKIAYNYSRAFIKSGKAFKHLSVIQNGN